MKFPSLTTVKSLMRRDRHVFVSMTIAGLDVALYELVFWGWRETAFTSTSIDGFGDDLTQIEAALLKVVEGWNLPPYTSVSWVLPPDILGVVHNKAAVYSGAELENIFPFSKNDVLVSKALNGRDFGCSILWIHKDWSDSFQQISQRAGLRCCEFFTRAQLFTMSFPSAQSGCSALIEDVNGDFFLHIFNSKREIVRSKGLGKDLNVSLDAAFAREFAAVGDTVTEIHYAGGINQIPPLDRRLPTSKSFSNLPQKSASATLRELALSWQLGIQMESSDPGIVRAIALVSVLSASLLMAGLVFVLWQTHELDTLITQWRGSVRKDLVVYEEAKALRVQSVRFAKVIELREQFTNQPESFKILAHVLGTLGPDASVQFFSQSGQDVYLAGGTNPLKNKTSPLQNTTNFRDVHEIDPRTIKEAPNATFARHLVWNDPVAGGLNATSKVSVP